MLLAEPAACGHTKSTPMKLSYRKVFFYAMALVFVTFGVYLTLLMRGLVFSDGTFSRTGGIFLNIIPSSATLFVNGERYPTGSGIFDSGTLVTELPKGQYHLLVTADGMVSWEKVLAVEPGSVVARNYVRLFPVRADAVSVASSSGTAFWKTGSAFILKTASGTLELSQGIKISGSAVRSWDARSPLALVTSKSRMLVVDTSNPDADPADLSAIFPLGNVQSALVLPHPFGPQQVIAASGKSLFTVDVRRGTTAKILSASRPIIAIGISDGSVFAADGKEILAANLTFGTVRNVSFAGNPQMLTPSPSGKFVAAASNGMVSIVGFATGTPIVSARADAFTFSPEERRFAAAEGNAVTVYYLDDWHTDFQKKAGDTARMTLAGQTPVNAMSWLDPQHLLVQRGTILAAVEIDEELPTNTAVLARNIVSFSYRYGDDVVYALTTEGIFEQIELE